MAAVTALSLPESTPSSSESLGREISELCSYIYAAEAKLLDLIRQFDTGNHYVALGFHSTAHWLNYQCGMGMNSARERVRVAKALADLPKLQAGLAEGRLSYSKVRALTRIADSGNEDYLLNIATYGTAHHVEKLVSMFRRSVRLHDTEAARAVYENRELLVTYDEYGALIIKGRFPAEQGALILNALNRAMEQDFKNLPTAEEDREAVAADAAPDCEVSEPSTKPRVRFATRRADGLAAIAETYMNNSENAGNTADRYQVVVHVTAGGSAEEKDERTAISDEVPSLLTAGASPEDPPAVTPHIENGSQVIAETAKRVACDCSVVPVKEDYFGEPLSIGRKSRSIPPSIRRALTIRDGGCRFPGCTHTRFVDGHHIQHWADGGETSLDNLVLLCRHHHRLVHEGGFSCSRTPSGEVVFADGENQPLKDSALLPGLGIDLDNWLDSQFFDLPVDGDTCKARYTAGEYMDWHLAVGALF